LNSSTKDTSNALHSFRRPGRGFYCTAVITRSEQSEGFILTIVLGIAGAFLATFIGQAIGHYSPSQGAGFITATIGALVVLFIWNRLVARGVVSDPGNKV
jgi:uncharacterized membrane protein YeaQ/YmgE (transglycosylase-associated protein family)